MNNSRYPSHPWRARSREFATHLAQLPAAERAQLVAAERKFLAAREAPFSSQLCAVREFAASMVGVREIVDAG